MSTIKYYIDFLLNDYVKVKITLNTPDNLKEFLKSNVGQIDQIFEDFKTKERVYKIFFTNIPENILSVTQKRVVCKEKELIHATPEEIENKLIKDDAQKYNL